RGLSHRFDEDPDHLACADNPRPRGHRQATREDQMDRVPVQCLGHLMMPEKHDRVISLEQATITVDPVSSERVETWTHDGPDWTWTEKIFANYKPVSDGEKVAANEKGATLSARFTVRYDSAWSDVNPKDRLIFEGRVFDIWGAKEVDGRRQFIE